MSQILHTLRLYAIQTWFAYRILFAVVTPFSYFTLNFSFPLFCMLFFIFMGKFAGLANTSYIVIGNLLLLACISGLYGLTNTIGNERQFGTLSYLLGSPAPRAPLFFGRAIFHVLDSLITVAVALAAAILVFHLDLSAMNLPALLACILLLSVTTSGLGFVFGSISLISRDGWLFASTFGLTLYVLVGVNFPVDLLPPFLKALSFGLPMTRGIMAARLALAGAGWAALAPLVLGELLVGALYICFGYGLFRIMEKRSLVSGTMDNL